MRNRFDEQLETLNKELIDMGAMCEEIIGTVTNALFTDSPNISKSIAPLAQEIDRAESDIESMCLKLLLHQQPVARDLRQISAALKMITDMERIGDQAEDIAEIIGFLHGRQEECGPLIKGMANAAGSMVAKSVTAYVNKDIISAENVIQEDDVVDDYFKQIKNRLIERVAAVPEDGEYVLDLLMIAKYLERIGDHAVNIAEWVIFSITGNHKEV